MTADIFPVVANMRTKSIQKEIVKYSMKSTIDKLIKVGSEKALASKLSCFVVNLSPHFFILSSLQASKTKRQF